jgi:hypothetical protein
MSSSDVETKPVYVRDTRIGLWISVGIALPLGCFLVFLLSVDLRYPPLDLESLFILVFFIAVSFFFVYCFLFKARKQLRFKRLEIYSDFMIVKGNPEKRISYSDFQAQLTQRDHRSTFKLYLEGEDMSKPWLQLLNARLDKSMRLYDLIQRRAS